MRFAVENKIPFIAGRLEEFGEVEYLSPEEFTSSGIKDKDAIIIRTRTRCDSSLLEGTNVRLVVTATIGTDHIDLDWCAANGIEVRNAAGCNAPGVTQYVWSSILRMGFDPAKDILGIVGVGHVGSIVAGWGIGLGARLLVCDPPRKDAGYKDFDYVSIDDLLGEADVVTLHTPLTKSGPYPTYHLIGERELSKMKDRAVLVNSSRGPVVDNQALADWIGRGAGRGVVDVWEGEPSISPRLLGCASIATPHIAGYSLEGKQRATRMAIEAAGQYFGFNPDVKGLCGDYVMPASLPEDAGRIITESYDPFADTSLLKQFPGLFEQLRGEYKYRREPDFRQR